MNTWMNRGISEAGVVGAMLALGLDDLSSGRTALIGTDVPGRGSGSGFDDELVLAGPARARLEDFGAASPVATSMPSASAPSDRSGLFPPPAYPLSRLPEPKLASDDLAGLTDGFMAGGVNTLPGAASWDQVGGPADPGSSPRHAGAPSMAAEASRLEAAGLDLTRLEPLGLGLGSLEPSRLEPTSLDPTRLEQTSFDPTRLESTRLEPTSFEPTSFEPTSLDPTRLEPTGLEPSVADLGSTGVGAHREPEPLAGHLAAETHQELGAHQEVGAHRDLGAHHDLAAHPELDPHTGSEVRLGSVMDEPIDYGEPSLGLLVHGESEPRRGTGAHRAPDHRRAADQQRAPRASGSRRGAHADDVQGGLDTSAFHSTGRRSG